MWNFRKSTKKIKKSNFILQKTLLNEKCVKSKSNPALKCQFSDKNNFKAFYGYKTLFLIENKK